MPGKIRLFDVMRSLTVTIKDDGFQLESVAGKAFYNAAGLRGKVEGIPEYFPASLMVKDESKQAEPKPLPYGLAGNYPEDSAPLIESARIRDGLINSGHICGNTIEQETLSEVLANTLHNINPEIADKVAQQLAGAVKSAFSELAGSPDGPGARLSSEYVVSFDTFRLHRAGEMQVASRPATKTQPGHEADKTAGAINLKLELDTGDICKQIDEAYEELTERIKATNQWSDIAGLQALSNRVSRLEAALAIQGGQITALQAK